MGYVTDGVDDGANGVRINKLKGGYTWNVRVAAGSNGIDDLREAKERALSIAHELEEELDNPTSTAEREEEIPF